MRNTLFIFFACTAGILAWTAVTVYSTNTVRIIACDVGQGDGILVQYKTQQILIDGGKPNGKIVPCLSRYMPFWDRTIEVVLLTHPQLDHFGGLIDVFQTYTVQMLLANSLDSDSQEYRVFKSLVAKSDTRVVNPVRGEKIRMGLITLDILNPTREFLAQKTTTTSQVPQEDGLGYSTSNADPNDFSLVAMIRFGEFDALFTGDIGLNISDQIAQIIQLNEHDPIEYLKVPHHGSKNGLSSGLLEVLDAQVAVISSDKKNSYGHPHQEILKLLRDQGVRILRTDEDGDSIVETNGRETTIKKDEQDFLSRLRSQLK